jgi:hypothetical protein
VNGEWSMVNGQWSMSARHSGSIIKFNLAYHKRECPYNEVNFAIRAFY